MDQKRTSQQVRDGPLSDIAYSNRIQLRHRLVSATQYTPDIFRSPVEWLNAACDLSSLGHVVRYRGRGAPSLIYLLKCLHRRIAEITFRIAPSLANVCSQIFDETQFRASKNSYCRRLVSLVASDDGGPGCREWGNVMITAKQIGRVEFGLELH